MSRPNAVYNAPCDIRLDRLDTLSLDISSSAIRRALARGEEPAGLPPAVLRYLEERGLYR